MKYILITAIVLLHLATAAQDPVKDGNKCYEEKNYSCAIDNYKKAVAEKKYAAQSYPAILYRIGQSHFELKKYEQAIPYFKDAVAANPNLGDAYWSLGGTHYAMKEYEKAADSYSKAIELFKDEKQNLKSVLYWRAQSYYSQEKYESALSDLKRAIAIDSSIANYHAKAGDALYSLEEYDQAIGYYLKSIELGSTDRKVTAVRYYWLGEAYLKEFLYDKAIAALKGSIEYNPDYGHAHWALAAAYYNLRKWPDAIAGYTKALSYFKDDTLSTRDITYYRSISHMEAKDYAKAIADLDAIVKRNPNDRTAIWQKATVLDKQKKYKEANVIYTTLIDLYKNEKSNLGSLYYYRGKNLLQMKDTVKAKADFMQALSNASYLTGPNVQMGHLSFAEKKYYEAKDYYGKGVSGYWADSAEIAVAWFRKGFSNLITGVGQTGKSDLETSIKYDSLNKEAHRYLGEVYFTAQYFALAASEFEKCIRLYKDVKDSLHKMYSYRGMSYSKQGKYKEALADYEQADKLKPNNIEYVVGLGQIAFETKAYDKVIAAFTKAIGLYKPHQKNELAFAYYARGRAHHELKSKEKAKKDLEKAIELVPTFADAKKWLDTITKSN